MERAVFVPDLDRLPPAGENYDRLYLGSEFCPWRLPDEKEIIEASAAATRRGMAFTLVTPVLDEPGLAHALELVKGLPLAPGTEVVANDLGLIEALRSAGWQGTLVAGRLLTRQRRGPGFQSFGEVPAEAAEALRGSALDSPAFVDLLRSRYEVHRFELDDLVQGVAVPPLAGGVRLSLYRPWLLVTAMRNCPWVFDGHAWGREEGCPRPCLGRLLRLVLENGPQAGLERVGGVGVARSGGPPAVRSPKRAPTAGSPCAKRCKGKRSDRISQPCTSNDRPLCRPLILGGCAQFLEHRSDAPPPEGVDRIVWQPDVPA